MSYYQTRIKEIVPDHDPRHIEGWMRLRFGTLDGLYPDEFKAETLIAAECTTADPEESEQLAQSYGL